MINSRLVFNLIRQRASRPRMQPSIKQFFQTKHPAKQQPNESAKEEDNKAKDDLENVRVVGSDCSPKGKQVNKTNSSGGDCLKLSPQQAAPNNKRTVSDSFGSDEAEGSEDDDDDEVVIKRKKRATSFLDSPPSKREMSPKKRKVDTDDGGDEKVKAQETNEKTEVASREKPTASPAAKQVSPEPSGSTLATGTPSKQQPQQNWLGQSPQFGNVALIRKKIASGLSALHENIGDTWFKALQPEFDKPYFRKLSAFIEQQRKSKTVFPPANQVFTWTHHHPIRNTRVVIIGQDPYHGPRQAHGLSFSVQQGVSIPKSLQNIYKELANDIEGFRPPAHGNLVGWAKQGVLMLNACLTVNQGEPNSHQGKGWEILTDAVISWISKNVEHNVVFVLWGRFAQKKSSLIDKRHKILTSAHPSPLSADSGFFGCKHFSQTNAFLRAQKLPEINWSDL